MPAASPHLARLGAAARPAGSGAADARADCAAALGDAGFVISKEEFWYSKFPGAWAAPAAGVLVPTAATVVWLARPAFGGLGWSGFAGAAAVALALLLRWVGSAGVLHLPLMRRRAENLVATRARDPAVWLVAHIDSKWQPVSMLTRVAGVVLVIVGLIGLVAAAIARPAMGSAMLAVMWIGGVPLMLSVVGARNHGTLDNASGVATVLDAVALLPRDANVGVLITDAEELALAGARAFARGRSPGIALNCDTVDDDGPLVLMYTKHVPRELVSRFARAASRRGEALRALRLIPGILTDSVALADAGWETLTLSRGTLRTLQRIHTRRDTLESMRGTGISGAARVLADVALEIAGDGRGPRGEGA